AAKLNKKPDRIRVVPVKTTGTLQTALASYNTPQNKLEELSVVNGMRLTDQVTAGMLIKVIGQ
ncbi:MAG TPA: hypothetical protein VFZ78_02785, partial [Flavisolibacter sp.]